jgi:hypothetical protein
MSEVFCLTQLLQLPTTKYIEQYVYLQMLYPNHMTNIIKGAPYLQKGGLKLYHLIHAKAPPLLG